MYSLMVAFDENQVIGHQNGMPWHLPNDLKYFKKVTTGKPIVMGRKTFESIGRPLPNRENIIMTRDEKYEQEGCTVIHSWDELDRFKSYDEIIIIGGSQLFEKAIDFVDRMYVTKIHETFEGDTYFPEVNWSQWEEVSSQKGIVDEKNKYEHVFYVYERDKT
ncbi:MULTISPECIES: dihydrofolate reductase [Allobacillus]|uniref:Dihydrofolate reductase n=1 Tax=Allobacillus halotolerans TaxID=570278 RepID=A0ABS6GJQ4_9BACI|nr:MULTISPECIES: dihydrofolate reductase [Allobacillus]MBU6079467.1 dihydrofolate reductase [Allobacillus halotolerans]TSJ69076.1 dihydrofolate reductase [Allobacillus sp. SKP2-8]